VLQPIFQEDLHYAALISFYSTLHQLQRPNSKVSEDVVRCTVKALSKHRAHLQDLDGKADELAIYTALQLTLFAEATGDMKSFTLHRKNIKLLVDLAGGFHQLPPPKSCSASFTTLGVILVFGEQYKLRLLGHIPCICTVLSSISLYDGDR
jgi:hypothetical protein